MRSFLFPLVKRQFRGLKWFAIGFALLACFFAASFNFNLTDMATNFWRNGTTEFYNTASPIRALRADQSTMLVMLGMLTVAMAVFQMLDAYKPQNALLMGSLPPTRGAQLAAQLSSGIAIIALSTLLFGLLAHLSYANHQQIMVLQARMSALPGQALADNTHWVVAVGCFRLMVALISLYLGITMFYGLFGNAALSLSVLAAMALFAYIALDIGHSAMYSIHRLYPNLEGFSGNRVFNAAVGMGVTRMYSVAPGKPFPLMPWTDLPWFLLIHALLWAAGLFCISQTRKHLAVESLGSLFPFKVSRWALVLIATAFPLLWPLREISVYDYKLEKSVLNPDLYIWFIPALLVFAVGWVFVIWRPQRRLKRRALPAVALALALLLTPGLARAEKYDVPTLEAQFDASRLSFDKARCDRNQELSDAIGVQREEARKLRDPDYDEYDYTYRRYPNALQEGYNRYQAKPTFDNYRRLGYDYIAGDGLGGYNMNEQELAGVLRDAGLDRLADALLNNTADSLLAAQDGYFLSWTRRVVREPEKNPGAANAEYSLMSDTQFQVVGSEAVDAAIRLGDKARRTSAFSNGELDTQSYEFAMAVSQDAYYDYRRTMPLHAVFRNGSLDRLMLGGAKESPLMPDGIAALRRALIAAGQPETDANAAIDAIERLYADDKLGSGSSGAIRWSLSSASWRSSERRIMIELG